jgi:hypothetical protein
LITLSKSKRPGKSLYVVGNIFGETDTIAWEQESINESREGEPAWCSTIAGWYGFVNELQFQLEAKALPKSDGKRW